ncbi:TLC domain-containing protein 4-B-like [Lineus longissimus]|uniref:TLC domain-containing protein 4-B-like n=1 Tax=Lineus longissimus TaxID=88925 RepID=UPI002B4E499D
MMDASIFPWPLATILAFFTTIAIHDFVGPFFSSRIWPKYATQSRRMRLAWDAKLCSTIHALFLCTCATLVTLLEPDDFFTSFRVGSPIMKLVYCTLIGYEIADLRHMTVRGTLLDEIPYVFHHIAILVECYCCLLVYDTLDYFFYLRICAEYAVPFVNIRWFLRYPLAYPKISKLYLLNGVLLLITYTVFRVGFGPFYHYKVYQGAYSSSTTFHLVLAGLSMDVVNIWWYWQILTMVRKVLLGDKKEEADSMGKQS